MTPAGPYFPLDELADPGVLPFGELLDEVLEHIWIANPGFDSATDEGIVSVFVDKAVSVKIPGVPSLELALGSQPGGVDAEIRARFTPQPSMSVELPLTLRVDAGILRPLKPDTYEPDLDKKTLDVILGSVRVGFNTDGDFLLDLPGGTTLPRCMIGTTGVILSATNVRWLSPGSPNLPASVPSGFSGLHFDGATIEFADLPIDRYTISMRDVYLGTGGFSGVVHWDDRLLTWDGADFNGVAAGGLCGFKGALTKVHLVFKQSALTACDVQADLYIPYVDKRVGLDLALDGRGGFSAAAGLPTSKPAQKQVTPGTRLGALLHLDLEILQFDLDEIRFSTLGGSKPNVALTGRVKLDIKAINAPSFAFKKLTIDTDGNVTIDGGWLDLTEAKVADIHGFQLEISRIGFGSENSGRVWFGLNGELKLAAGLPMGASVEGLKVSWDPKAPNPVSTVRVSLEGIGLEVEMPNVFRFKGSVALFSDDPAFGNGFAGHITLKLLPVKLTIDAQLLIGRTHEGVDYFFLYLAVDLPTGIPLFSTGAAFYGFAGLVAVNLRPDRRGDESWWHGWHQRPPKGVLEPRKKWRVDKGAFAVGLGATIGTQADDGFMFSVKLLLILSLPGPVIFLQGKGAFVTKRADSQAPDSTGQFEALVVLDIPAKLFSANLAAAYEKKNLVTIRGEADAAFSWARISPPDVWHLYVGEKDPPEKRVRALLLELLKIDGYLQLRESGIALGGRIAFDGDWHFGPVRAWAHAHLSTDASLGFKPLMFEASLGLHGDAGIAAFGAKVLIVLDGKVLAKGPKPWYLAIPLHLEIVIDLWAFKWSFKTDVPLEWGDKDPLPDPATPTVASIGAQHPKVFENVAVLNGATVPPDARPVVIFNRPVLDRGMVGTPNTGALDPDTVGPRNFSYRLGHIVLASGTGATKKLVGAAGVLEVANGTVRLPAGLQLPDVAGATLDLLPGPVTLPVTARTAAGLSVIGTPPDGEHPYRLRAAQARANVQVSSVRPKPLGTAELTLAADPGVEASTFAGGSFALAGTTWRVLESGGTAVMIAAPGALPGIGNGELTGSPPPVIGGSWLPVDDRTDAAKPGPTTKLMLWARTPFAWFRGTEQETYAGFDAHNPDYACGPEPTENPICVGFDDVPRGTLSGAFRTDLLHGSATGHVAVLPSGVDPDDHHVEIGLTASLDPSFGAIELTFDPPVEWVQLRCATREGGTVTALRHGATIATASVTRRMNDLVLTGEIDTIRVEGTQVTLERVCFTPGWTCVPFAPASFPQGKSGEQTYAGLKLYSCSPMQATGGELWVDPVNVTWPIGGINPQAPISGTLALISVWLPQPVTRVRFRVTHDCQVWVGGGGVEILETQATAGQTISVTARHGFIDQLAISAQSRVGMAGLCFDAGPFGWLRQEQWSWRKSMQVATETLSREDPVLAPGDYTVSVLCGVEITGRSPATVWDPQSDATFKVDVPPGLTTATGNVEHDRRYPAGGALADLSPYVETTVPVSGERPAYRAYDVGIAFNEPYVSRMFLMARAGLSVAVVDPNGRDRRAGAPNLWGRGPDIRLGEQETEFIKTLHGDGTRICAPVDMATLIHDEGVTAGAGELLAPGMQHVAELRAAGHTRPPYRFLFTTSRFADFRHQLASFDGRARRHPIDGTGQANVTTLGAAVDTAQRTLTDAITDYEAKKAAATTDTPTDAQLDAYPPALRAVRAARAALALVRAEGFTALWSRSYAAPPPALLPEGVELTHVAGTGGAPDALLLESAEPIRWERTVAFDLASASVTPLRLRTLSTVAAGAPDLGAFRWDGVNATTDVELWTHLGALRPRVDGPWNLILAVPEARRVRLQVSVGTGGTAALNAIETGPGAAATSGPTGSSGPATLEVTGTSLTQVKLTGTRLAVLSVEIEEPFEPIPASGPLRLSRGVLPPPAGSPTHSIDVTAYADTALEGHQITWFDPLNPSVGGAYHAFAGGTSIADGRTARVYGGVGTTPAESSVDLYAGGTVGVLPATGVVFRLIGPNGSVLHELCELPDTAYTPMADVRVFANSDQTRAFLLAPGSFKAGFGRLRLRFLRDAGGDLPRLSVGGDHHAEETALGFVLR